MKSIESYKFCNEKPVINYRDGGYKMVEGVVHGQIPRNGLTLEFCPQQWGSHYYII